MSVRRLSANAPCRCDSGRKAKGCCLPALAGTPALTPEALMRSRYTAYAVGNIAYVMRTTDPAGPKANPDAQTWAAEVRQFSENVSFDGLEVRAASASGDTGEVTFFATLAHAGTDVSFGERSRFVRRDGQWLYVDGDRLALPPKVNP